MTPVKPENGDEPAATDSLTPIVSPYISSKDRPLAARRNLIKAETPVSSSDSNTENTDENKNESESTDKPATKGMTYALLSIFFF